MLYVILWHVLYPSLDLLNLQYIQIHHTWNSVCSLYCSCFSLHLTHYSCSIQIFFSTDFKILENIKFIMQGPSWEINCPCGSRENIFYFWYLRAHYCVHTCPSWLCILPQTNPVQTPQIISLKTICANVSQAVSFFQVFYPNICMHFSLSHVCYMTYP
jgi:hypothetical protein